jgi:hypothetical protein
MFWDVLPSPYPMSLFFVLDFSWCQLHFHASELIHLAFRTTNCPQGRLYPLKVNRSYDVVCQVDLPYYPPSPDHPDREDQKFLDAVGDMCEDVFSAGTNPRLPSIAPHLSFRQGPIAMRPLMNLTPYAPLFMGSLDLLGAVRTIGAQIGILIRLFQKRLEHSGIMDTGIGMG